MTRPAINVHIERLVLDADLPTGHDLGHVIATQLEHLLAREGVSAALHGATIPAIYRPHGTGTGLGEQVALAVHACLSGDGEHEAPR
jgi:hypothetical protein